MYVRALLSMIRPSLLISVSDLPEQALNQCGCNNIDVDFYQMPNSTAAAYKIKAGKAFQLPPSCLMTGCSAALLSAAEV